MKKIILCAITTFAIVLLIHGRSLQSQPSSANGSKSSTPLGPAASGQNKPSSNKDGKDGKDSADKGKLAICFDPDSWQSNARKKQLSLAQKIPPRIIRRFVMRLKAKRMGQF